MRTSLREIKLTYEASGNRLQIRRGRIVTVMRGLHRRGHTWSGGQITNMVTMALALAIHEKSMDPEARDSTDDSSEYLSEEPRPPMRRAATAADDKTAVVLRASHFRAVVRTNTFLAQYRAQARGASDEMMAEQLGLRKDDYIPEDSGIPRGDTGKYSRSGRRQDSESDESESSVHSKDIDEHWKPIDDTKTYAAMG